MSTHQNLVDKAKTFSQAGLNIEKVGKHFVIIKTQNGQRQRWELYPFIGPIPKDALRYKRGAYTFSRELPS
jgi:hypothetical protein